MVVFERLHCLLATFLLACGSPPPPGEPRPAPQPVSTPAPAPSASQAGDETPAPSLAAIVDRALERSQVPTSVVVLNGQAELLVLAGTGGADPAKQALRPGSTVKPLLALGASRLGTLPAPSYTCEHDFAPVEGLTCYGKHGTLDLPGAIEQSCNVYFYDLGYRLGLSGVHAAFRHYGFGSPTGLVNGENVGRMPSEAVLRGRQPNPKDPELWPGFAPVIGIGHGAIQVTLLQLTRAYAQLAHELTSPDEPELAAVKQQILSGLRRVVEGSKGSGVQARVPGLDVAGKTGSAERGQFDDEKPEQGPENGWFVAFAPAEKPELVVGTVCLGGGFAGKSAAPIVGEILREALAPRTRAE